MKYATILASAGMSMSLLAISDTARAGILDDIACAAFKVSDPIGYFSFVGALDVLASAGAVTSVADCEGMGNGNGNDVAQLFGGFLPQTLVACVCKGVNYPPPPHDVGLILDPPYSGSEPMDNVAIGLWGGYTCGAGERMTGMSRQPGGPSHDVLCLGGSKDEFSGVSTGLLTPGTQRTTRVANGSSDWALGFFKFECGLNEYVSGAAEFLSPIGIGNGLDLVSCATSPQGLTNVCQTRTFDAQEDRSTTVLGDWDYGSYKGECGFNQYVAGISVDTATLAPHSILCCNEH
jgi:hypothetical protein